MYFFFVCALLAFSSQPPSLSSSQKDPPSGCCCWNHCWGGPWWATVVVGDPRIPQKSIKGFSLRRWQIADKHVSHQGWPHQTTCSQWKVLDMYLVIFLIQETQFLKINRTPWYSTWAESCSTWGNTKERTPTILVLHRKCQVHPRILSNATLFGDNFASPCQVQLKNGCPRSWVSNFV